MKGFLQGKWLGHPLHPILVHIPMALWPAALFFDLVSALGRGNIALAHTSFYCILAGLVAAALAIPTGLADWWEVKPNKPAWKLGIYHMVANLAATVVWLVNLVVRFNTPSDSVETGALPVGLSIVGTLILIGSGYLGGRMVYAHGIGVARHSKKRWRQIAKRGGARLPPEKG